MRDVRVPQAGDDEGGLLADTLLVLLDECTHNIQLTQSRHFLSKFQTVADTLLESRISVDSFKKQRIIGRGHYGDVYLVKEKNTDVNYAMKVMKKTDYAKPTNMYFFENERHILAQGNSPWLTQLQFAFHDSAYVYLVMDFNSGGDLLSLLERFGDTLDEKATKFYSAEICQAINAVHEIGFCHGDIKPENILVDREGHIKMADFGSASRLEEVGRISRRPVAGTPEYLAPEILLTFDKASSYAKSLYDGRKADWWSYGVVLYEMLYGRTPFEGHDEEDPPEMDNNKATFSAILKYKDTLKFPPSKSAPRAAIELVKRLLTGSEQRYGYQDIKCDSFFRDIVWSQLRSEIPPYVPFMRAGDDASHFEEFEAAANESSAHIASELSVTPLRNLPFVGFSYARRPAQSDSSDENFYDADEEVQIKPSYHNPPSTSLRYEDHTKFVPCENCEKLQGKVSGLERQIIQLQEDLNCARHEATKTSGSLNDYGSMMTSKLESLQTSYKELTDRQTAEYNSSIARHRGVIDQLTEERTALHKKLVAAEEDRRSLKSKLEHFSLSSRTNEEVACLETARLKDQLLETKSKLEEMQTLASTVQARENTLRSTWTDSCTLRAKLAEAEASNAILKSRLAQAKAAYDTEIALRERLTPSKNTPRHSEYYTSSTPTSSCEMHWRSKFNMSRETAERHIEEETTPSKQQTSPERRLSRSNSRKKELVSTGSETLPRVSRSRSVADAGQQTSLRCCDSLEAQLAASKQHRDRLEARITELEVDLKNAAAAKERSLTLKVAQSVWDSEKQALERQLAEAKRQAKASPRTSITNSPVVADLKRQLETCKAELREMTETAEGFSQAYDKLDERYTRERSLRLEAETQVTAQRSETEQERAKTAKLTSSLALTKSQLDNTSKKVKVSPRKCPAGVQTTSSSHDTRPIGIQTHSPRKLFSPEPKKLVADVVYKESGMQTCTTLSPVHHRTPKKTLVTASWSDMGTLTQGVRTPSHSGTTRPPPHPPMAPPPKPISSPRKNQLPDSSTSLVLLTPSKKPSSEQIVPRMRHAIPHRFEKGLNTKATKCSLCLGNIHFMKSIARCKACDVICHERCSLQAPESCGMPSAYARYFKETMSRLKSGSPVAPKLQGFLGVWRPGMDRAFDKTFVRLNNDGTLSLAPDFAWRLKDLRMSASVSPLEVAPAGASATDAAFCIRLTKHDHPESKAFLSFISFEEKLKWSAILEALVPRTSAAASSTANVQDLAFNLEVDCRTLTTLASQNPEARVTVNSAALASAKRLFVGTDVGLRQMEPGTKEPHAEPVHLDIGASVAIYQIEAFDAANLLFMLVGPTRSLVSSDLTLCKADPLSAKIPTNHVLALSQVLVFATGHFECWPVLVVALAQSVQVLAVEKPSSRPHGPPRFTVLRDFQTLAPVTSVTITKQRIILGAESFYQIHSRHLHKSLITLSAPEVKPKGVFPIASCIPMPDTILLCYSTCGVFFSAQDGVQLKMPVIPWDDAPLAVAGRDGFLFLFAFHALKIMKIGSGSPIFRSIKFSSPRFLGLAACSGAVYVASFASSAHEATQVVVVRASSHSSVNSSGTTIEKENKEEFVVSPQGKPSARSPKKILSNQDNKYHHQSSH